jgi:hypothetical protein
MVHAASAGLAEATACDDPMFSVSAGDASLGATVCEMATDVAASLSTCGLTLSRPLEIAFVEEIVHAENTCLGAFDCEQNQIMLTRPERFGDLVEPDNAYALLPSDILLRALLTHELSHAAIHQSSGDRVVPLIDHEFIANALELEFMDAEWRSVMMEASGLDVAKEGRINIWIYHLAPRRFAANAWLYFSEPGNGCALVERILEGQRSFHIAIQ